MHIPILVELLQDLSTAKELVDVNIAAGVALERIAELRDGADGPTMGQQPRPVMKPN